MATEHQIYLASRSPRRGELLNQIGVRFAVIAADTDESRLPDEAPEDYVRRVALDKARTRTRCWRRIPPWSSPTGFWENPAIKRTPPV